MNYKGKYSSFSRLTAAACSALLLITSFLSISAAATDDKSSLTVASLPETTNAAAELPLEEATQGDTQAITQFATEQQTEQTTVANSKTDDSEQAGASAALYGDVVGNGKVTTADCVMVQSSVAKKITLTSSQAAMADVNQDGSVTMLDAVITQMYLSHLILSLPYTGNVDLVPTNVSLVTSNYYLGIGESRTLVTLLTPRSAKTTIKWYSSNTNVVTVSDSGVIKAVGSGGATVTACTENNLKTTCNIFVQKAPTPLSLKTSAATVAAGQTYQLTPVVPSGCVDARYTYTSNKTSVATVSSNGKITAVAAGTATVTVKTYNGKTAAFTVTVQSAPTSVSLSSSALSITVGKTANLSVSLQPSGCYNSYTLTSSNTSVATVSAAGTVTAKAAGTANITAKTYNGKTAVCAVTVKADNTINSIALSATETTIKVKNHAYITAVTSPAGRNVSWSSSNTSVATVSGGVVTGVSAGTATITAADPNGSVKKTINISIVSSNSTGYYITYTACSVTAGKSVYFKSSLGGSWSSSDTSVATVDSNGFVTTKKAGVAIISKTSGSYKRTCALTVGAAAPVKYSYTSPNSAVMGDDVTFVAITDKTRTAVQFKAQVDDREFVIDATSKTLDSTGNNYVWKGKLNFTRAGHFSVKTYSKLNGVWSTCDDGDTSVFVTNIGSTTSVSANSRRPSDKIIDMNSQYEGFNTCVVDDNLVDDAPTMGYGHVVYEGEKFYNYISKEEAYAFLVRQMNDGSFASAVNNFMSSYNIKFNQQQFDALVMLCYNLGSGVLNDSSVKSILTDCVESTGSVSSTIATVNATGGLNLRSGAGTGYSSYGIMADGSTVTVLERTTSSWYKVRSSSGTVGYCASEYLTFKSATVRNMNLVNKSALKAELIQWHHAGGNCVWGLLYRRIDELEVFCYGDYIIDGRNNKYNMSYNWNCNG